MMDCILSRMSGGPVMTMALLLLLASMLTAAFLMSSSFASFCALVVTPFKNGQQLLRGQVMQKNDAR